MARAFLVALSLGLPLAVGGGCVGFPESDPRWAMLDPDEALLYGRARVEAAENGMSVARRGVLWSAAWVGAGLLLTGVSLAAHDGNAGGFAAVAGGGLVVGGAFGAYGYHQWESRDHWKAEKDAVLLKMK